MTNLSIKQQYIVDSLNDGAKCEMHSQNWDGRESAALYSIERNPFKPEYKRYESIRPSTVHALIKKGIVKVSKTDVELV